MAQLDAYILGGNWSDPQFTNSLFALQGIMENVLYGGLIPKAWADHTAVHPVVVFQSGTVTNPLTVILKGDAEDYGSGISDSVSHILTAMQVFMLTISRGCAFGPDTTRRLLTVAPRCPRLYRERAQYARHDRKL